MCFEAGKLLIAGPVCIDQAQLVVVAACTGEDDSPDVLFCGRRWTRDGRHRCR